MYLVHTNAHNKLINGKMINFMLSLLQPLDPDTKKCIQILKRDFVNDTHK